MTDTPENKYYVLEWTKDDTGELTNLQVTPHNDGDKALDQAQNSAADVHCVSTVNPLAQPQSEEET